MRELPLVLALDASGSPQRWIDHEDSAFYYAKGLIAWSMGETDFTLHGGTSRMTGQQSSLTINTIVAIKGKVSGINLEKANRVPLTNKTLFHRDHQICAYCGDHFKVDRLTRDHILPTSRGGHNIWQNVITACSPCNHKKNDRTPEEAKMELLYLPYVPNRAEALIMQNRNILACQMDFLIKQVPKMSRLLN